MEKKTHSEAPSGFKAKKKEKSNAAQQKMEMNGEDLGNCCQAEFPQTGLTHSIMTFAMKLK